MSEHQQTQQSKKTNSTFQKQTALLNQNPVSSHPAPIIQRASINPKYLTSLDILQLQRTIGNRAVGRLLSEIGLISSKAKQASPVQRQELVQRQEIHEEEEPLQGKMAETVQRQKVPEEEEPLQGMFKGRPKEEMCSSCFADPIIQMQEIPEEEEPLQGKFETIQRLELEDEEQLQMKSIVQRQEVPDEEEPLQKKMIGTVQSQEIPEEEEPLQPKRENNTGMPDNLKVGVESLSGIDMSDVRVHYNSSKPAEVGALAYTQGTHIHVAPGQERHLPHEAWHVVQQMQGRVKPTMQLKDGVPVNDDEELEREADVMGGNTVKMQIINKLTSRKLRSSPKTVIQKQNEIWEYHDGEQTSETDFTSDRDFDNFEDEDTYRDMHYRLQEIKQRAAYLFMLFNNTNLVTLKNGTEKLREVMELNPTYEDLLNRIEISEKFIAKIEVALSKKLGEIYADVSKSASDLLVELAPYYADQSIGGSIQKLQGDLESIWSIKLEGLDLVNKIKIIGGAKTDLESVKDSWGSLLRQKGGKQQAPDFSTSRLFAMMKFIVEKTDKIQNQAAIKIFEKQFAISLKDAFEEVIKIIDITGSSRTKFCRHDFQPSTSDLNLQIQLGGSLEFMRGSGTTSITLVTMPSDLFESAKRENAEELKSILQKAHRTSFEQSAKVKIV